MLSIKKITYVGLLLLFLHPLTLPAQNNNEPLQLPERIILGEDKTLTTVFSFREETRPDTALSLKAISTKLPSLSFSSLTVSAGNQENFAVAFSRQSSNWSLGATASQAGMEPFPEPVREVSLSINRKKMVRAGILNFSFSVARLWNLPASKKIGGDFVPAALTEGGEAVVSLGAAFFPERPLSARISLAYHILNAKNDIDLEAVWPVWSLEAGVTARLNLKTKLTVFLDCPFSYDNPAVEIQGMCLPGAALSYQLRPNNVVTLTIRNLTDQRLEILPGYFGPGLTANLSYSRSF
ncbi:MAG: hypothetical protein ABIK20_06505 [Candidatus Omnitrophota bacterium]|nr:hypothetical protein [Candidatus Omnitrophota bacterium]